jgi:nitrite reductase/ring-hydroxylating ferredoxin subunit
VSGPRRRRGPASAVRRRTLALLGAGLGAPLSLACDPPPPPDRRVRLALEAVPPGERVEVEYDDIPVEVRRGDSGIEARGLLCTHFGCRVRWREEASRYVCACHGGEFDARGRPVAGPPQRPLLSLPVERDGDTILVGEP